MTVAIMGILATAALSLSQATAQRAREVELRRTLREVRTGIDRFKAEYDKAKGRAKDARADFALRVAAGRSGYPLTLDELVETRILRRIPRDPMNRGGAWVSRSFTDRPDSTLTDRRDVFDVRSASTEVALDGTTYDSW